MRNFKNLKLLLPKLLKNYSNSQKINNIDRSNSNIWRNSTGRLARTACQSAAYHPLDKRPLVRRFIRRPLILKQYNPNGSCSWTEKMFSSVKIELSNQAVRTRKVILNTHTDFGFRSDLWTKLFEAKTLFRDCPQTLRRAFSSASLCHLFHRQKQLKRLIERASWEGLSAETQKDFYRGSNSSGISIFVLKTSKLAFLNCTCSWAPLRRHPPSRAV